MRFADTKILAAAALLGFSTVAFATDARIGAMGKTAKFIMDDVSIFDNPANIGIYPNYLIGELGTIDENALVAGGRNVDPSPWFGGIFSLPLGGEDSRDPRITIGGVFNRTDSWASLLPDKVILPTSQGDSLVPLPELTTNFDGFLGGSTPSGNLYAAHIYVGMQDGAIPQQNYETNSLAFASIVKFDLGVNWQVNEDVDLEVSAGLGRVAYGESDKDFFDAGEFSWWGKGRLFSTIEQINGELVPEVEASYIQAGDGMEDLNVGAGMGVNMAMDRGFFWLGLEGFYHNTSTEGFSVADDGSVVRRARRRPQGDRLRRLPGRRRIRREGRQRQGHGLLPGQHEERRQLLDDQPHRRRHPLRPDRLGLGHQRRGNAEDRRRDGRGLPLPQPLPGRPSLDLPRLGHLLLLGRC